MYDNTFSDLEHRVDMHKKKCVKLNCKNTCKFHIYDSYGCLTCNCRDDSNHITNDNNLGIKSDTSVACSTGMDKCKLECKEYIVDNNGCMVCLCANSEPRD